MVGSVQIEGRRDLREWAEKRKLDAGQAIAQRTALRVFPLWSSEMGTAWAKDKKYSAIPVMVQLLAAGVARHYSTSKGSAFHSLAYAVGTQSPEIPSAAAEAAHAALSAAVLKGDDAVSLVSKAGAMASIAASDDPVVWKQIEHDAEASGSGKDLATLPLWVGDPPDWFINADRVGRENWARDEQNWIFWKQWWDGVIQGSQLNWELQRDVAEIASSIWRSEPDVIANAIAKILDAYEADLEGFESVLSNIPAASADQIDNTRKAIELNRHVLPPTFDAIEGLLILEIERLQNSNDRDEEWKRQIRVYLILYEAICQLRSSLAAAGAVTVAQATRAESVVRLYLSKFKELPRAKADEVIDGFWTTGRGVIQAGLIGSTTALAVSYGLPAMAGVAIGSMIFAPKNAADLVKAAREAIVPPK